MTIGDVLAAIAAVFGVGAAWGAAVLLCALAFPKGARRAQDALTGSPGACAGRGLLITIAGAFTLAVLSQTPVGRVLAAILTACLAATAALGSAGIVSLLGGRIEETGTHLTPFAARTRGTALYVAAGFLPVVGWFLIVPVALVLSLGAGTAAWKRGRPAAVSVAQIAAYNAEAAL